MSHRIVLFVAFLLVGLTGCVSYGEYYPARDRYYQDGGYYYPADDGYGDYYEAPDDRYYGYDRYDDPFLYGYLPFWTLDRYACGAWHSCSPYWDRYYRRPYSGWSLSFGSHWSYGRWGWYDGYGSSWHNPGYYRPHYPRPRPGHDGRPGNRPPPGPPLDGTGVDGDPRTVRPTPMPRPDFERNRIGRPVITDPEGRPGNLGGRPPARDVEEGRVQPLPRPDFRDTPRKRPDYGRIGRPQPVESEPLPRTQPRPDFRDTPRNPPDYRRFERPQPDRAEPGPPRAGPVGPRPAPRTEPRTAPRDAYRPAPRTEPQTAPREAYRPAPPPASRPAPPPPQSRPSPPPRERAAPEETRGSSQNRGREVED
ncbi:hypothetical protein [Arenimonas alkanexedens]